MAEENARQIEAHAAKMRVEWQRQRAAQTAYEADSRHARIVKPRVELEVRDQAAEAEDGAIEVEVEVDVAVEEEVITIDGPGDGALGYYLDSQGYPLVLTPRAHELSFKLLRHPLEMRLHELLRDFITAPSRSLVRHVQAFLARQHFDNKSAEAHFQLHVVLPSLALAPLSSDASLAAVVHEHGLDGACLDIRYQFTGELPAGLSTALTAETLGDLRPIESTPERGQRQGAAASGLD